MSQCSDKKTKVKINTKSNKLQVQTQETECSAKQQINQNIMPTTGKKYTLTSVLGLSLMLINIPDPSFS